MSRNGLDFDLTPVAPPTGYEAYFEKVVLVERLREVRLSSASRASNRRVRSTILRTSPTTDWAVDAIIGALRTFRDEALMRRNALLDCVSLPHHRARVRQLLDVWTSTEPVLPAIAMETAITSAARAFRSSLAGQSTSLIWTGPQVPGVYLRRIEQALVDVVNSARHELLLVTFAAYPIPMVRTAIRNALDRGVNITFVGEASVETAGRVSFHPSIALGEELVGRVALYIWPHEKREAIDGRVGMLHAKCAVADESVLLISSANLTDNALAPNMELGGPHRRR